MPFVSQAQARKFFALNRQGKISNATLKEYVDATPSIKALPEKLMKKKASFVSSFEKVAGLADTAKAVWKNPKALDHAGLAALGAFPAYDVYQGLKNKDSGEVARGGAETVGLGLLHRAVAKAKH